MKQSDVVEKVLPKPRPIIKWTGGKFDEFSMFSDYIPNFANYFEPFFGGGGVFFALRPKGQAYLNDKSTDLVNFYSLIGSKEFKNELLKYAEAWDEAGKLSLKIVPVITPSFSAFINDEIEFSSINETVEDLFSDLATFDNSILFDNNFIVDKMAFLKKLKHSVADKCKRIKHISKKEEKLFAAADLKDHIETSIKSGLYLYLRSLTNLQFSRKLVMSKEKAAANWYFVREFCYASMFRFNSKGEFNIPYGGIAYNKKNFRAKVSTIFSEQVKNLFAKAKLFNLDFEEFLKAAQPQADDFIFVDPPYDSEFSEYDQNAFTAKDQERLRDVLMETPAKWMMVIKETDFIRELYTNDTCKLIRFDKTYTYNVRGRNNRDTQHLIIVNYNP